eukprot:CAMPEP_0170369948 /NCGR_PEP_ID=MMETSP0117_2-20130122/8252_1 /TAXON_ID=400756 /ORGANISM="Durinskia baltica, Strain CSIRO CS-38" /LENGTH=168 /DNA_ID=CAMNT_0010624695 /DNA_START=88 /DNA_END=593 /DNA_ORIENTATION=-
MVEEDKKSFNVPVFSGGLFTTAQIKIWKEIVNNETGMSQDWESKWGMYRAPKRQPRPGRRALATSTSETFIERSQSVPALTSAGPGGGWHRRNAVPPCDVKLAVAQDDPRVDRARVLEKLNRLPARHRYKAPVTSAHQIGWSRTRASMELFGPHQYGRVRNDDIMPDY